MCHLISKSLIQVNTEINFLACLLKPLDAKPHKPNAKMPRVECSGTEAARTNTMPEKDNIQHVIAAFKVLNFI